ncbi:MAG: hypothetical protein GKR89_33010 [Candidatus Latescibacteria bacterium]|nr:hypothetical protein [Candidatus Latescibacterota bacterium]
MPTTGANPPWINYLLPLPKEIEIAAGVRCRPGAVGLRLEDQAGSLQHQGIADLVAFFETKAGVRPEGAEFTIEIGLVSPYSDTGRRLQRLKNNAQAYLIEPQGQDGLVLAALDERGLYYACRTLIQLLEYAIGPDQVHIPLARIVDWPDMDERGLWNFPEPESWIPWLAAIKLNYGKMASTQLRPIERDRPNRAIIDAEQLAEGRRRAFNYLPYILHLNFLHDCGLFRAYPELAGKGDGALTGRYFAHKTGNQHRAPCASQPILVAILQEWMEDIAAQGAGEISCWLSERPGQCGCLECTAVGQFVVEARAFVAAWQAAQKRFPQLQIRIFLSTTTEERDYRVLDELPPQVKIERACATELERVLHRPRDVFASPLLDHYAAQGRWIASYDVPIAANGRVDTPEFKVPQRSAQRIRDFVGQLRRRGYSGAYGMLAWGGPERKICSFNIHALAEWTWHAEGRDEGAFALAWARRQGFADPEAVARWAVLLGPVEFDVYDSAFPVCYSQGLAAEMVRQRQRPYLGEGVFRYYLDRDDFAAKLAVCDQALAAVRHLQDGDLANETQVVRSYVELAQCIYWVAEQVATLELADLENQALVRASLDRLQAAGENNVQAIAHWRAGLGEEPWHYRVHDAIKGTQTTVTDIVASVSDRYFY